MHFVGIADVRRWYRDRTQTVALSEMVRSIGRKQLDSEYLEEQLLLPLHLRFVVEQLAAQRGEIKADALDSIPFYSLCRGLFLPLSGLQPEKVAQLFGIAVEAPPDAAAREALLARFLDKKIGLSLVQKLACILGDPFMGKTSTFKRDSLMRLLGSMQMLPRRQALDRLTVVGDVAVLFAELRPTLRQEPALTAVEVLELLRLMPDQKRTFKFDLLRSLFERCGKLEAYFLAKLILRKAGFGFDYQGPLIARTLAEQFNAPEEQVAHAMALTDAFAVARILAEEGAAGLRKVQLQPLVAVRPALASGTTDEIQSYPVWVECKYDSIRLMLHKSTDARGAVLCAAYTRNRGDWLELVPGLDASIKMIPAHNAIIDGELHGTVVSLDGARPASVYEVYGTLQGDKGMHVNMKFAAFDVIYLNGRDLTRLPLSERRNHVSALLAPLQAMALPVPITVCEGQLASSKDDVNRLFHHFRAQGYEGVITKDLAGPYQLAARDPSWRKRKPEVTLDLVLLGAVFAVTEKERAGLFGSYVIGARTPEGTFEDVGDVAGVDRIRDAEIQAEIMREGLITGRRIERESSSGRRPGLELRPHIVVTVKFEGIARDFTTKKLSLRDPKLAIIRADKNAQEADSTKAIEELYLRSHVG